MSIRVTPSNFAEQYNQDLQISYRKLMKAHQHVYTGQRVVQSSDDPVAAYTVIKAQAQKRGLASLSVNRDFAKGVLDATYDRLNGFRNNVDGRVQQVSLLVQDLSSESEYSNYATEVNELLEQALLDMNATYQDENLFAGDATKGEAFVATRDAQGDITAITYNGASTNRIFAVGE
ncbi:MAG: hypothetical protein B7X06_03975, partial [Verrucomicrobia bacterium 21-51-4]